MVSNANPYVHPYHHSHLPPSFTLPSRIPSSLKVKDNVLFNQPLEPRRYYQALYASALVSGGGDGDGGHVDDDGVRKQ